MITPPPPPVRRAGGRSSSGLLFHPCNPPPKEGPAVSSVSVVLTFHVGSRRDNAAITQSKAKGEDKDEDEEVDEEEEDKGRWWASTSAQQWREQRLGEWVTSTRAV